MNQASSSLVSRELLGHVLLLGLDRVAKRNAFDLDLLNALSLAYGEFDRNDDARVAVVFAHGDHFTAGLGPGQRQRSDGRRLATATGGLRSLGRVRRPSGRQTGDRRRQGYCLTLGIELMLAADINLCASNTRFAQMEVQRGIFPFGGATLRFHQIAGWGNAMRWLLTGDEFDAHEALRLGLVQEVMASEDLLPRAIELASRIARQAPPRRASHVDVGPPGALGGRSCRGRRVTAAGRAIVQQRRRQGRRARHAREAPGGIQGNLSWPCRSHREQARAHIDRIPSGCARSNVGAGLLAMTPVQTTRLPAELP
ncbi:MAG: crotonase/enoyl-CoA hydratase family protein [Pseudomonas veronii]|jgi:enoyl-CoA hydratase/carnithine racemase|nr:crotonase/enoyl-CoA hydratase family protein [Pseudomonas veronii]